MKDILHVFRQIAQAAEVTLENNRNISSIPDVQSALISHLLMRVNVFNAEAQINRKGLNTSMSPLGLYTARFRRMLLFFS